MRVSGDGSLEISERLTFSFSGSFQGAYREIPLRAGERLDRVAVAEGGTSYRPGAPTGLGSTGAPHTFGVARAGKGVRIVWHYRATDERRVFTVSYRLSGLAVAYDDVVDVNLQVWGAEWDVPLDRLRATLVLAGRTGDRRYRVWGHPAFVRGDVRRRPDRALLSAVDVPARQFVELRVLFPRTLLGAPTGAHVVRGRGFQRIVAEEQEAVRAYERDRRRVRRAVEHPLRSLAILLALGLLPGLTVAGAVYLRSGRERGTGYDRRYEQEPPSELQPALVAPLLRQRGGVGSLEFTATLFDLIRRGRYEARPVTTTRSVWGGLRAENVADLELEQGAADVPLALFERPVAHVVDEVLSFGPERLTRFRERIEDDREENSRRFTDFRDRVADEIRRRRWFVNTGLWALIAGAVVLAGASAVLLAAGVTRLDATYLRWSPLLLLGLGVAAALNSLTLVGAAAAVPVWRRRSGAAQQEAERWEAFRRFLADFPRLEDAPPASLELWERYLVYGIAFGLAERVLQAAHLHMPPALHEASSVYWISPNGDLGSGPSALAIGDLSAGFGS
ncbi:MAG: DUF2207 domain-containing protein, partial [Thermoleophilia bacterium]|nr:DUF2207 domain-containing protein [Thermoleophilia bacterium]